MRLFDSHPPATMLLAFAQGKLSGDAVVLVGAHLLTCESCSLLAERAPALAPLRTGLLELFLAGIDDLRKALLAPVATPQLLGSSDARGLARRHVARGELPRVSGMGEPGHWDLYVESHDRRQWDVVVELSGSVGIDWELDAGQGSSRAIAAVVGGEARVKGIVSSSGMDKVPGEAGYVMLRQRGYPRPR